VFPRQGKFAHDPNVLAAYPSPDVTIELIGDLLSCELSQLVRKRLVDRLISRRHRLNYSDWSSYNGPVGICVRGIA
jgi:hypothetical protein